jgi:hypothetical protein
MTHLQKDLSQFKSSFDRVRLNLFAKMLKTTLNNLHLIFGLIKMQDFMIISNCKKSMHQSYKPKRLITVPKFENLLFLQVK